MYFEHDGLMRRVRLGILPPDWKQFAPIPIVIVLHDERKSADFEVGPDGLAARLFLLLFPGPNPVEPPPTVLLVVPEGLSMGRFDNDVVVGDPGSDQCAWNSGHRGRDARLWGTDDVGFIEALISELQEAYSANLLGSNPYGTGATDALDLSRIYVAGSGNGGEMAYRLACELPTRPSKYCVRSLAVIGGSVGGMASGSSQVFENDPALTVPPVPNILIIHGAADTDFFLAPLLGLDLRVSDLQVGVLTAEVGTADALVLAPLSYVASYSRDLWIAYAGSAYVVANATPPETLVDLPSPSGPYTARVTQWMFLRATFHHSNWPLELPSVELRFITTIVDDLLGHSIPVWDVAPVVWLGFTQPAGILP